MALVDEESDWYERNRYWLTAHEASIPHRKRRERQSSPLVLTGQGLSIRVNRGSLLIRDGHTHFPAQVREHRLFKGGLENPPRVVLVDGSGEITLDAIDWLAEQEIPLIRLRWNGQFASIISTGGQAADPAKARWQYETRHDPDERAAFARKVVKQKALNALETLERDIPQSRFWETGRRGVLNGIEVLRDNPPETVKDLLGVEGRIASSYFRAWRGIKINWKGTSAHPIPTDWKGFVSRSALRDVKPDNRRATHPVNAMLNYVYGALLARTQIRLIAEGFDPLIGIIHDKSRSRFGRTPSYALDAMEVERPLADRTVLKLLADYELTPKDFTVSANGTCRLGPELARLIAGATSYQQNLVHLPRSEQ